MHGKTTLRLLVAMLCTATAGCSAAASAALGVALNIAVKATELDTAVIENLRARRVELTAPPAAPAQRRDR